MNDKVLKNSAIFKLISTMLAGHCHKYCKNIVNTDKIMIKCSKQCDF